MITVEDYNGALFRDAPQSILHIIDTGDIGEFEFSEVKLDFCKVTHTINGDEHTFTFQIVNSNWKGKYTTFKATSGIGYDETNNIITFKTPYPSFKVGFYCNSLDSTVHPVWGGLSKVLLTHELIVKLNELGEDFTFEYYDKDTDSIKETTVTISNLGKVNVSLNNHNFPVMVYLEKSDFKCNMDIDSVTVGKINKVQLHTDESFLPDGDLIGDNTLDMEVNYNGTLIPVTYDSILNDYVFDLDLRDKTSTGRVFCNLIVYENDVVNQSETEFRLNSQYLKINNFGDLINEIQNGANIIELDNDFALLSRITLNHDLFIHGNNHSIDCNEFGFDILNNNTFRIENANFTNGDTVITQSKNSKVELTGCIFTNCKSSNYNNLGSVIYCDVDIDSLTTPDDFITNITNCEFYNNHNVIFHGGELIVNSCKYYNNDFTYCDNTNPAFLYQTDGESTIKDSIFDIHYQSSTYCNLGKNVGFGQALIRCGTDAIINDVLGSNLAKNDNLPFFDGVFNNLSHVFAKYYYPQIEECIITSPLVGKEDTCLCYAVSGIDWVFKENVQVTRVEDSNENMNRKIIWE